MTLEKLRELRIGSTPLTNIADPTSSNEISQRLTAVEIVKSTHTYLSESSFYVIITNSMWSMSIAHAAVGKGKGVTRSCEKCRHLERGTHVPDGRIPQREEVEMVRTCTKAR